METKIKQYFLKANLGKVKEVKEVKAWKEGKRFHVTTNKLFINEFTVYEKDGEVDTVRNLRMNKTY